MSNFDNYPKYQLTKHGKVINNILKTAEAFFGMNYEFTNATINDGFPKLSGTVGGGKKLVDEAKTSAIFESQLEVVEDAGKLVLTTDAEESIGLALSNYATNDHIKALFTSKDTSEDNPEETPSEPSVLETPEISGVLNGQTLNISVINPTTTRYKHELTTTCIDVNNSSLGAATVTLIERTENTYGANISLEAPALAGEAEFPETAYPFIRSIKSVHEGNKVTTADSEPVESLQVHLGAPLATSALDTTEGVASGTINLTLYAPLGLADMCTILNTTHQIELTPSVKVECKKYYYPNEQEPPQGAVADEDGRYRVELETSEFAVNESGRISYRLTPGMTISATVVLDEEASNDIFISGSTGIFNNFITCPAFATISKPSENTLLCTVMNDLPRNCFIHYIHYAEDDTVKEKEIVNVAAGQTLSWTMDETDHIEITYGGDYYLDKTVSYTLNDFES